ncbi:AraC family transcriptional regulator [Pseudomonas putida]|nr:AraC family transcriptional regulator [Pseudomonas putida]
MFRGLDMSESSPQLLPTFDDPLSFKRAAIASIIRRFTTASGIYKTAIAGLNLVRNDTPTDTLHSVYKPTLCLVVQGRKEVRLFGEQYVYDPLNYLVISVTLPLAGKVIEASPDVPYLGALLDIDSAQISQLIADSSPVGVPSGGDVRGLYLGSTDGPLLDALFRLLSLLDSPEDISQLAPMALREIFYRLLRGQQGQRLYEIAVVDSQSYRITRAIEWLNNHFAEPMRIEELARYVNLGVSTLHHRFKAVTSMSPLQYQKQLRLHEARRLVLSQPTDIATVASQVGYESQSQFSREYNRLFGTSPLRDRARLRRSS